MRKKIVAGNWKMNTLPAEGKALAAQLVTLSNDVPADVTLIITPPFTGISAAAEAIQGSSICLAAQNCADHDKGAYTGEISAAMVAATGCTYIILGHSERRQFYGDTNENLLTKTKLALANGLKPIFCIGENLAERENNAHFSVCKTQLEVLFALTPEEFSQIVVAYEPVWAIGTGKTASADQAQEIHAYCREVLAGKFGALAQETPILYGGSCNPSNAKEIFSKADVDGGLIGGAALVADNFIAIAKSF